MSDQQHPPPWGGGTPGGQSQPGQPGYPQGYPPAQPLSPPIQVVLGPEDDPPTLPGYTTAPQGKRRPLVGLVAAALGLVAVVAVGFVGLSQLGGHGGADTPEAAVEDMFAAIEQGDAIGLMESLSPSEREMLLEPMTELTREFQRLGVLDDFKLDEVPGAQIAFDNLRFRAREHRDDLVSVEVVAGRVTARVEPNEVPIGAVWDRFDPDIDRARESSDFRDADVAIAVVQRDGGWYVSLAYTIAEYARIDSGERLPRDRGGIEPVGADSPEGVVTELLRALDETDAQLAIEMLDPVEMEAVYDYASLFLPRSRSSSDLNLDLINMETRVEGSGNRRRVFIDRLELELYDDYDELYLDYSDGCWYAESFYRSGGSRYADGSGGTCDPGSSDWRDLEMYDLFTSEVGVSVVERGGRWYLAPVRTMTDTLIHALRSFDQDDMEDLLDWFEGETRVANERFESVGDAIDTTATTERYDW